MCVCLPCARYENVSEWVSECVCECECVCVRARIIWMWKKKSTTQEHQHHKAGDLLIARVERDTIAGHKALQNETLVRERMACQETLQPLHVLWHLKCVWYLFFFCVQHVYTLVSRETQRQTHGHTRTHTDTHTHTHTHTTSSAAALARAARSSADNATPSLSLRPPALARFAPPAAPPRLACRIFSKVSALVQLLSEITWRVLLRMYAASGIF